MRIILLSLFFSVGLCSCLYYGDIHKHSHEINSRDLAAKHKYSPGYSPACKNIGWWSQFNDPELTMLIDIAIADSPTMRAAEARVRAANHLAELASTALWPEVDLSASLQRQRFSQTGLVPPPFNGKTFNIGQMGLNFNYEFDFWGKNREALNATINEARASAAELAESQLVLSAAVAQIYFQLADNLAQLNIARESLELNDKLLQISSHRLQRGLESEIPVKSLFADREKASQSVEHYQQLIMLSRNQLAVILGKNPFTTEIVTRPFRFHYYSIPLPFNLPANLLANRPDVAAMKLRACAAANKINVAKARFFPDINLSAFFSYQSIFINKLFSAQNQNNGIIGAIDLPIFDAGARRANLKVKYAEYDNAVNEYNQAILTALREVADQVSSLHAVSSELKAQNAVYYAIRKNYQLSLSRYHHGINDYASVLERKNLLLQEKSAQVSLQTRHMQTIVALIKALGGKNA